jgi:hypothetical protein
MIAAAIIVFREILEAGLIAGIVLAVTRGISTSGRWVAGGVGAGVLGSCIVEQSHDAPVARPDNMRKLLCGPLSIQEAATSQRQPRCRQARRE